MKATEKVYAIVDKDFIDSFKVVNEYSKADGIQQVTEKYRLFDEAAECVDIRDSIYIVRTIITAQAIKTFKGVEHVVRLDNLLERI